MNTPSCIAPVFDIPAGENLYFTIAGKIRWYRGLYKLSIRVIKMEKWLETTINPNYIVSDDGRVRRRGRDNDHSVRDRKGYPSVDLYEGGKRVTKGVHLLVAEAFIPNPDNKPEVNHKDGNKHNNNVSNLEWVTHQENCRHAWNNGLTKPSRSMLGRKNPNSGRKGKPIRIIETGEIFESSLACEKAIDGNNRHINDCLRGRQNTHRGYHFEYVNEE